MLLLIEEQDLKHLAQPEPLEQQLQDLVDPHEDLSALAELLSQLNNQQSSEWTYFNEEDGWIKP